MTGETIAGKPVTEEQIQAWAQEAEAGYSTDELRRRSRPSLGSGPSTVVPVHLTAEDLAALTAKAEHDHLNRSDVIRAAIRAWVRVA